MGTVDEADVGIVGLVAPKGSCLALEFSPDGTATAVGVIVVVTHVDIVVWRGNGIAGGVRVHVLGGAVQLGGLCRPRRSRGHAEIFAHGGRRGLISLHFAKEGGRLAIALRRDGSTGHHRAVVKRRFNFLGRCSHCRCIFTLGRGDRIQIDRFIFLLSL